MFSGIIETTGRVAGRVKDQLAIVPRRLFQGLKVGESISVDGVCLTLHQIGDVLKGDTLRRRVSPWGLSPLFFRLLPETTRASTLGLVEVGSPVNLERSLRLGDRIGGHFLLGHVDGQGAIVARHREGETLTLEIELPKNLSSFLVSKGPIGVDGVSLTLDPKVAGNRIRVHLVAHTLSATALGQKAVRDRVNLEVDLIAKYLRAML